MIRYTAIALLMTLISCSNESTVDENFEHEIEWQNFNNEAFEEAASSNKLVLLEVGANWCHWCHVMDDSTYANPTVQAYLNEHFVLCREDQDARPDLFAAYRAWGWPAIIILNADGDELLRLKGYQPRKRFLADLKEIVANPIPIIEEESSVNTAISINEKELFNRFFTKIDHEKGGYSWNNKSLQLPGIIHGLNYAGTNDSLMNWTKLTVENSFNLVDPVWSGVYQYSARGDWKHQHYEKLLKFHASYIEAYAYYSAYTGDTIALQKAKEIYAYCERFLANETPLYWNSQNADLVSGVHSGEYYELNETDRLAKGVPSIDEHIYLKENAQMISALARLWAVSKEDIYLAKGIKMLDYILANYALENGLFTREIENKSILSFEDNRKLMDVLMTYYQITGDDKYLKTASKIGTAAIDKFYGSKGMNSAAGDNAMRQVVVDADNISAVLTYNLLGHISGEPSFLEHAKALFKKVDKKSIARSESTLPLLLRAEKELAVEPFHAKLITEGKDDKTKNAYLQKVLLNPDSYLIFEEAVKSKMTPDDAGFYGTFDEGTLFMCTSSFCSAPIYSLAELDEYFSSKQ